MNNAVLELASKTTGVAMEEGTNPKMEKTVKGESLKFPTSPKVYISYSHNDLSVVQQISAYFEQNKVNIILDSENLYVGESISSFIERSIRESDFILSIVSHNSLQSGWVSIDYAQIFKVEKETGVNKWIPCRIDQAVFDPDFVIQALERANSTINDLNSKVKKLKQL